MAAKVTKIVVKASPLGSSNVVMNVYTATPGEGEAVQALVAYSAATFEDDYAAVFAASDGTWADNDLASDPTP